MLEAGWKVIIIDNSIACLNVNIFKMKTFVKCFEIIYSLKIITGRLSY